MQSGPSKCFIWTLEYLLLLKVSKNRNTVSVFIITQSMNNYFDIYFFPPKNYDFTNSSWHFWINFTMEYSEWYENILEFTHPIPSISLKTSVFTFLGLRVKVCILKIFNKYYNVHHIPVPAISSNIGFMLIKCNYLIFNNLWVVFYLRNNIKSQIYQILPEVLGHLHKISFFNLTIKLWI